MKNHRVKEHIIGWIKKQSSLRYYEDIFDKNYANLNKIHSLYNENS